MRFRYHRVQNQHVSMRYAFIPITETDAGELRVWLKEHAGYEHVEWRFGHRGSVMIRDETKALGFRMRWS